MEFVLGVIGNFLLVVVGSGASIGFLNWFTDRKKSKSKVKFLATQLAVQLEGYALECFEDISNQDDYIGHEGYIGSTIAFVPELPKIPTSDDYMQLDNNLLDEFLQMPQDRITANRAAIFWDQVDRECANSAYRESTVVMGHKALTLSKKLRQKYKLPQRELKSGVCELNKFFHDQMIEIEERMKKSKERKLAKNA
ncbi:MAG: hypothetical protein DHS20C07_16890 [Methyloligella sp.]|nr:MAG: hypothetical protein DHS20C07_16890 [Methyloligella sp.]